MASREHKGEKIHPSKLPEEIRKVSLLSGFRSDGKLRSGSYFQLDRSVIFEQVRKRFRGKIEVMSTREALEKYNWVKEYLWRAIPRDLDEYTKEVEKSWDNGYFLRVLPGQRIEFPIQACMFIAQEGITQNVHNLVVVEEGGELQILTGCATTILRALHVGVSEFYVKRGGKLTFTMIHNWAPKIDVRPRDVAILEEGARFTSNYVSLHPVGTLQLSATVICEGEGSSASLNSLILGREDAKIDIDESVILRGKGSRGEVRLRVVGKDRSEIYTRGRVVGEGDGARGHVDCRGLMASSSSRIYSIPRLDGLNRSCELTHEAAVGKIRDRELWYLMSRGLTEEEATSLIIRGYLDPRVLGLPKLIERYVESIVRMISGAP